MKHENISELAPTIEDNNYPSVFMIYVNRGEKLSIKCNICWGMVWNIADINMYNSYSYSQYDQDNTCIVDTTEMNNWLLTILLILRQNL